MTHGLARVVSHEDGVEHVASAHWVGPTERIAVLGCGGMTQAVENGRRQVLGPHPSLDGVGADAVGSTVDLAALDTSAGEHDRADRAPVVPPSIAVQAGRAPELGHADDQCLVEKPATVQILEQRSVGPVGRRDEHLLEPQGFLGVAVPAGIGRRLDGTSEPVDVYQPDSALHQAAGEQHTLAERSLSIEVPVALGLILKAKCSSGLRGAQQIERPARLLRRTLLPVTCDRRSRDAAGSRREDS